MCLSRGSVRASSVTARPLFSRPSVPLSLCSRLPFKPTQSRASVYGRPHFKFDIFSRSVSWLSTPAPAVVTGTAVAKSRAEHALLDGKFSAWFDPKEIAAEYAKRAREKARHDQWKRNFQDSNNNNLVYALIGVNVAVFALWATVDYRHARAPVTITASSQCFFLLQVFSC